jgi:sulfonate transport system permease protein
MAHESLALTGTGQPSACCGPPVAPEAPGDLARPLSNWERLWSRAAFRKLLIVAVLLSFWQWYAVQADNPLVFPTFTASAGAFWSSISQGDLVFRVLTSFRILLAGYGLGVALAALLAVAAAGNRLGNDLLDVLTSMFNPLPAIALIPLAMLWFGLGNGSIILVLVHAVLWPVALNAHAGFSAIGGTLRMVGRNYGLRGWRYAALILFPAAFPQILTGLKNGWAFAWRTLIAAELVFGVSSGSGGVGWFIYENKNQLEIAHVFAGLLTVILIGFAVENLLFRTVEQYTVSRWGMKG